MTRVCCTKGEYFADRTIATISVGTTEDTAKCPEERDLSKNGGCITDAEIGRQVLAGAKSENLNDRPLQKVPSVWLANDTEPSEALLTGSAAPFDQFKVYEEMSGATAKYDESLYTTVLDPSKITVEQEMKAAEVAASIESARSTNIHIQEERGQTVLGDGMNEEEKFSAVLPSDHGVGEVDTDHHVPVPLKKAEPLVRANFSDLKIPFIGTD